MSEPVNVRSEGASPDAAISQPRSSPTERPIPAMSADLYRTLLENLTEGVSLSDEHGTIVYTNSAEDRMFGYGSGELIGQHVSVQNAYPPDENARLVSEVIAELKRSGSWRGEWLNRRKDGATFVTTSRISAVVLDGRSYWLCIQEDVTDEKAALAALEESRARLQLATEAAEIGIWDWDVPSGRMRYSARAKEICGFAPDREVTYDDARRVTHPDDYPQTSALARRALDPAVRERAPYEYRVVRPDGALRWVLAHGEAVFADVDGEARAVRYVGTLQDITERVRLEEAERQGAARLALAIQASRMAVWEVDIAADRVTGSPELNRLLGLPEDATPTAEEMRARYYPGERERLRALGQAALARGERTLEAEYRYVWPDGSVRWLWLRAEMIVDADGVPVRALGVIGDITERRRSEEALRASEARLKLAQRAAGIGVWDWEVETGAISWSPEMFEILGLDPVRDAAAPYAAWLDVLHPDDRGYANDAAQRAVSHGDPFTIDFRITHGPSGEQRWVRSHGVAVLDADGRPGRVVGVNFDITEERRREQELRALAGDLRSAVEASEKARDRIYELSNDLFAVAGFDGYLKTINPAWERLLGHPREALLAKRFSTWIHPDDLRAVGEFVAAMQAGAALQQFENRVMKADGTVAWIAWAAVPEGDLFYAVGRDITREKEQAEALRQSQKMEAMGQLTGGVAHDFNNLLTPIVGALDVLQRRGLGGEREQRLISGAVQSAEKAKTLVQRLLAFARRQPLQPSSVDVGELTRGMAELIASTTGPQIRVVVDAPGELPSARADANQLEMAILNLAVNARDAMPEGGTLRISVDAATVGRQHRSQLPPGRYLHLSVADTGVGMDDATLARAVEPFYSTKGVGKGTGLGLSMAHGLAAQLGGALTIQSTPGLGTNVELWLPQGETGPAATTATTAGEPARGKGTVLLVDDEDLVRLSTADMLIEAGYTVLEAASAEEALRLLARGTAPDMVVTDHLMPGMSGTELAGLLRRERPSIKVLIVSGYASGAGIAPDLPRLAKPFRGAELATALLALN